jgi:hypothetical protein
VRCTRRNAKLVIIATSALTTMRIIPAAGSSPESEPPLSTPQNGQIALRFTPVLRVSKRCDMPVPKRSSYQHWALWAGMKSPAPRPGSRCAAPSQGVTFETLRIVSGLSHGRESDRLLSGPPKHSLYLFIDELEKERVRVRESKLIASGHDLAQIPPENELLFCKEHIFLFATHAHHVL